MLTSPSDIRIATIHDLQDREIGIAQVAVGNLALSIVLCEQHREAWQSVADTMHRLSSYLVTEIWPDNTVYLATRTDDEQPEEEYELSKLISDHSKDELHIEYDYAGIREADLVAMDLELSQDQSLVSFEASVKSLEELMRKGTSVTKSFPPRFKSSIFKHFTILR